MFQVTQIVRFLLERGLRFRNLGFCGLGHGLVWTVTFNAPVPIFPEGLAFFPPFLEGHDAFDCDQDLALTVRIRDLNRRFGGLQVPPRLRLHVADAATEAPAAREEDDAAPLVGPFGGNLGWKPAILS